MLLKTNKYYISAKKISDVNFRIMTNISKVLGVSDYKIIENWGNIVSEEYKDVIKLKYLKHFKTKAVLTIEVQDAGLWSIFNTLQGNILTKTSSLLNKSVEIKAVKGFY